MPELSLPGHFNSALLCVGITKQSLIIWSHTYFSSAQDGQCSLTEQLFNIFFLLIVQHVALGLIYCHYSNPALKTELLISYADQPCCLQALHTY